jgi:hypothetical protein
MNDTDLIYDEESSEERMKAIGQNGNTGEHYANIDAVLSKTFDKEPTWTHTITKGDQRTMSQAVSGSTAIANEQQLPDARKHQIISFIKSGVRLFGYVLLPFDIVAATVILFMSEVIGILEELV